MMKGIVGAGFMGLGMWALVFACVTHNPGFVWAGATFVTLGACVLFKDGDI